MIALIGQGIDRKDGRLKVTGQAKYAAEFAPPFVTHAVIVQSTIVKGRVKEIDSAEAEKLPGVLVVISYKNSLKRKKVPPKGAGGGASQSPGSDLFLQTDRIMFRGQHVALVVAETLEQAKHAASLLKIEYEAEPAITDMRPHIFEGRLPRNGKANGQDADTNRGDIKKGLFGPVVKISHTYSTPQENHNPMEMHATVAQWDGEEKLTVWDATQYITGTQESLADAFDLKKQNVRVIDPFVGGGFGCKGSTWPHVVLTAMAAKMVNRPVRLMLTRSQMFTSVGYRSPTHQNINLAATADGKLTAMTHEVFAQTARYEEFLETCALATRMLYDCPNQATSHRLVGLDVLLPTYMRAPGESTGVFALESAMDELAYALKMDPLQLRLANYAESDPEKKLPFSSKSLRECYQLASEKFAWDRRSPDPRSINSNGELVGYGMATATYPTMRFPNMARVTLQADGSVLVQSGTQDLGTGTYTMMAQTTAAALGVDVNQVRSQLGDSTLPPAGVSGGSATTAGVASAILNACNILRDNIIKAALADESSPLHGLDPTQLSFSKGKLVNADNLDVFVPLKELAARTKEKSFSAVGASKPGSEKKEYSMHAFGAVFVEVRVDPNFGTVRVPRIVAAYAAGRIVNAKTARSQFLGGLTFGLSMALFEETVTDHRNGKIVNDNLADYLLPVNADIHNIDIIMVPETDPHVNEAGVKGIGEIGIVGAPAAIANAVFHATGKRIRDLPITPEKLL